MTNKKVAELDAECIEYKGEAKASMGASIKAMKEEFDTKFEELKQLILGTSTHMDHVPQTTKEFRVDPQAAIDREMQHMMGINQTRERVHRGARTNQAGDRFAYQGFKHQMRKLKMPVFEGEDAYEWIYRVERYFEIQGLLQHEKLRETALCMEGEALSWYRWSEGRTSFHS
ncbi:hypothetical protein Tco_0739445 [Tanacetum coccineum]